MQGTLGLELMQQTQGALDAVIVPVSGGGMLAGVATAVKGCKADTVVLAAEPRGKWGSFFCSPEPVSLIESGIERKIRLEGKLNLRQPVHVVVALEGCLRSAPA